VTGYTIGWLAWIAWFLVEEGLALFKGGTKATLSGHVWQWFGINAGNGGAPATGETGWTQLRRFGLAAFLAWLSLHFLTGGAF
jgi:hypothetical protein